MNEKKQQVYKMIFDGKVLDAEKLLLEEVNLSPCLLALIYAIKNKNNQAKEILKTINNRLELDTIDQLACEEAELAINSTEADSIDMLLQAEKIVKIYQDAAIANYFLAKNTMKQRKWDKALGYYMNAMRICPDNDGLLLDVAKVLFFLKKSSEAMDYVKRATPSLRQRLYLFLIPLGKPVVRVIVLLVILGLFVATRLNVYVYVGFIALMGIGFLLSFVRDSLISSSFLYVGAFGTIIWFFSRWAWWLMQGG